MPTAALARRLTTTLACLAILAPLAGCAVVQVTGYDGKTDSRGQSETAAATALSGRTNRILVTYNDDTGNEGLVEYTATSRTVKKGASLMGWSYSDDKGASWTYGGKVKPPAGWSVLWGDPAITTSRSNYNVVFMSNLAIPDVKMPAQGIDGSVIYGPGQSYIGGACIARSTNGGTTFGIHQCVANTDRTGLPDSTQGHFYDGGSMAALSSGEIFAAYVDVYTGQIDVWRSPSNNGQFARLPTPFPGLVAVSHPRLRTAPLDAALYVAATVVYEKGYRVYMNRYVNGQWGNPVRVSESVVLYPSIDFGTSVLGQPLTVRTGPQFSFDVGAPSENGVDGIRMLYTRFDGRYYIDAVACTKDLTLCQAVPGWRIGAGSGDRIPVDRFNPNVAAWIGFIGLPPSWQGSYVYRYNKPATGVHLARLALGYVNGNAFTFPVDLIKNTPVCSDTRGYWGDYDAHIHSGFSDSSPTFLRFITSSVKGCLARNSFNGVHQHVQGARY